MCGERGVMIGVIVKEVDPEADTPQDPEADIPHRSRGRPRWRQPLKWAVRILLECILVSHYFR